MQYLAFAHPFSHPENNSSSLNRTRYTGLSLSVMILYCDGVIPTEIQASSALAAPMQSGGNRQHHQFCPSPDPMITRRDTYSPDGKQKES